MRLQPADFRPPGLGDRIVALVAMADARGELPEAPRCRGYENCCFCPVCQLREKNFRAGHSDAEYLRFIGFDDVDRKLRRIAEREAAA